MTFDLDHPYLRRHLIAYIGNKRSLLGFLAAEFRRLEERARIRTFLDPFAGSGAVSRLARLMGYEAIASDWEPYAYILNRAHLGVNPAGARDLFRRYGGLEAACERLNRLPPPMKEDEYIACYYAPRDTTKADYRTERLFYTRENALIIDAARSWIEEAYPDPGLDGERGEEKALLLASLLYQCATHTNTSGVFKAFHKGFGGHSRDALGRILGPIRMEAPVLIEAAFPSRVHCLEAEEVASRFSADLAYLDPPYNQHQYGSNYHLLNTIALWDRLPVSEERRPDGVLKHKAGIRPDWKRTRSPYCVRGLALPALKRLLESLKARFVAVSYNTEGIVPFEELMEALAGQGRLEVRTSDYVKYRGGRQSLKRQTGTLEVLLILDRAARNGRGAVLMRERILEEKRLRLLLRRSFDPSRIRAAFATEGKALLLAGEMGKTIRLPMFHFHFFPAAEAAVFLPRLPQPELAVLAEKLAACECPDRQAEIQVLVRLAREAEGERERRLLQRRILLSLRKFAFRKYRRRFEEELGSLKRLVVEEPAAFQGLLPGLQELEGLALRRLAG